MLISWNLFLLIWKKSDVVEKQVVKKTEYNELVKNTNAINASWLDYDSKIKDIENKYFTISDYNKFTIDLINWKIKKKFLDLKITLI